MTHAYLRNSSRDANAIQVDVVAIEIERAWNASDL
jgi:hypothetical protein